MWCEWCENDKCKNVEYKEKVMESDGYESFLDRLTKEYDANLKTEFPSNHKELTPKRYVKKIRYWHYEHYALLFGYVWGKGN